MTDLPYPPPYQDLETLSQHLCAGESTIERLVQMGQFPKPRKLGGKRVWSWAEVCRFIDGPQETTTTNLLERITNATRKAARPEHHERGVRKRDPGISCLPEA